MLSGCLAINMLLGAGGVFVGGPLQYAGTAYTVCEYTYEYTVNERSPGTVFKDRIVWLMPQKETPREKQYVTKKREVPATPPSPQEPVPHPSTISIPMPAATLPAPRPRIRSTASHHPQAPQSQKKKQTASCNPQKFVKLTQEAAEPSPKSDRRSSVFSGQFDFPTDVSKPSATYLRQRLQREFPALDRLLLQAANAYRIRLPDKRDGINGAWEIRHTIDEQPLPLLS